MENKKRRKSGGVERHIKKSRKLENWRKKEANKLVVNGLAG